MQFSTYRNRYIYFNKLMRRAKTKKLMDKLAKTKFKEVGEKNENSKSNLS